MQGGRRSIVRRSAIVVALLVAACSGSEETGGTDPPPSPTPPTTEAPRPDDGVLRIGVMAPLSGEGAAIGQSVVDAVTQTIGQINEFGGVAGRPVTLVVEDEGATPAAAGDAIEALLEQNVDAVVGPTSSVVALNTLGDLLAGGVMACSPTATALALGDYPSSERFFRTAPSDALQAEAVAELAERTGSRSAAIVYLDDTYGRPMAQATIAALQARELSVDTQVPFAAGQEDLDDLAAQLADPDIGVIVLIGDADEGTRMLSVVGDVVGTLEDSELPAVIVNAAMRQQSTVVQELAPALREQVRGVSPVAGPGPANPDEPAGLFATNAIDCLNLIALAAVQASSDNPVEVSGQIVEASSTGVGCADFAACVQLLDDNRNIDYEGPSGDVEIGADGDPQQARFEVFTFDENGVDQSVSYFWL